ncbi:MAG: hypothetical protein JSS32_04155 [Verrucomicrobia bacterium]|nr:hypothetical protein [Verrucomicrobiota bacterium]
MKRFGCLLLLIGLCAGVGKVWHWAKDGFNINRTFCELPEGAVSVEDDRIEGALAQTYTYLGRGHQCYAFGSADGKYVVKLPRYDRYGLSFFLRSCRFSFLDEARKTTKADLDHRFSFILESFRIAYEELKEDTAVIYLHLNKTNCWKTPLKIKDRLGRTYLLDADRTAFILQEKKPIMMAAFQECLKRGDRKGAEEILDAFLAVVVKRAEKGIYNKDPSFLRNFGWDGERGIQIDIGSFYRKLGKTGTAASRQSFSETMGPVRLWLAQVDPEISERFEKKVQSIKESWPG